MDCVFNDRVKLYIHYLYANFNSEHGKWKTLWIGVKYAVLRIYHFNIPDVDILFLITNSRKDYSHFLNTVYGICDNQKGWIEVCWKRGVNLDSMRQFLRNIKKVKWARIVKIPQERESGIELKEYECGIVETLFNLVNTAYLCVIQELILKEQWKNHNKQLMVLSDVWSIENVIVNLANEAGLQTVTCQHGLYLPNINDLSWDILNYWSIPSKFHIAWGDVTKKLLEKYNPRITSIICGNPTIEDTNVVKRSNIIGIIFDQPKYMVYNKQMLSIASEIAKEYHMKIKVRIHPQDKREQYLLDSSIASYAQNLDDANTIIGHTTSMIFIYLIQGYRVLHYQTDVPFHDISEKLVFYSKEGLEKTMMESDNSFYIIEGRKKIRYIGKESLHLYRKTMNGILHSP